MVVVASVRIRDPAQHFKRVELNFCLALFCCMPEQEGRQQEKDEETTICRDNNSLLVECCERIINELWLAKASAVVVGK